MLKKMEIVGDEEGKPTVTVKIVNSGELHDGRKLICFRFMYNYQLLMGMLS